METIDDAKDVATLRPLTIAIPSEQGVALSRDSSSGTPHSQRKITLCPAYRFYRESRGPYRSPMLDSYHNQQITIVHDLLQAIKEAALKLIQLIANNTEELRRRNADPQTRYPDSGYKRCNQPDSPECGLTATASSSVCALCGVTLHLKDSSNKSIQFVIDTERSDDNGFSLKHLGNMFLKTTSKIRLLVEGDKKNDNFPIPEGMLDYILPKESDSVDIGAKGQEKISSKTQSTDTSDNGLKSKLLFIRRASRDRTLHQLCQDESQRGFDGTNQMPSKTTSKHEYNIGESSNQCIVNISSTISSTRDASTLTQEMLCPCACGLLIRDETGSKVPINSIHTSKNKSIKNKLEEFGLHLESRKMTQTKVRNDRVKVKKPKMQQLGKDTNVKRWIQEVVELRLQVQIEELHKNIKFFKQENEYFRRLSEKCRYLSEDITSLEQLLPIRDTHSGLTTTIRHLQAEYHNEHGIIATLTGMFRGSINIQQIAVKLLASFIELWIPRDNIVTTSVSSPAPRAQAPSKPPSSIVFNVY